jgi:uncharacterized protein
MISVPAGRLDFQYGQLRFEPGQLRPNSAARLTARPRFGTKARRNKNVARFVLLFAAICLDKPDRFELRLSTRAAHLAFLEANAPSIKLGGPFLDDDDKPVGSLLILDCADAAAARTLLDGDPYAKAGLFESVALRPWRRVVGAAL